ncbi:hypothetical protein GJ744_009879 [Endocarpon pusillum]|uniref:Uncharacterized protein n=1 Tax=Endocarpon pusillum TaxID=364733 RepID=A0A8H7AJ91_9EURO|nr:hypothetical protein GJ744_009879 [Endocarpon pusillum]
MIGIRAQRDQDIRLQIARYSRQIAIESRRDQAVSLDIAQASKAIARQSRKDSSSMKTIAAVTISFLPGTFVASFFAMPLFEWDSDNSRVVSPQIWIYCIRTNVMKLPNMGIPDNAYLGASGVSNPAESRIAHLSSSASELHCKHFLDGSVLSSRLPSW